jgi:hypothetical protein
MIKPNSAAEAVAQGAQLLDEKEPGWWREIDLGTLELSSCKRCICGQLGERKRKSYESYVHGTLDVPMYFDDACYEHGPSYYGFDCLYETVETVEPLATWDELDAEWEKVILARREADKLVPAEEREMVTT